MREETPIELAFSNEVKEIEFFLGVAERAQNPLVRNLFKAMAKEDMELLGQIGEVKQMTIRRGRWFGSTQNGLEAAEWSADGDVLSRPEAAPEDFSALRDSIRLVQNGAKLFAELAQQTADPNESRLYHHASSVETEHMRSLNDALFCLENPQGWLGDRERSGLDGA